ncbi:MAG: hypothetical protein AB7E60_15565 [Sphingobium sp.]
MRPLHFRAVSDAAGAAQRLCDGPRADHDHYAAAVAFAPFDPWRRDYDMGQAPSSLID